jgi:hypothetical protein
MKKIKLESLEFNAPEILSRMQLKHVMGGDDGSGSSTSGSSKGSVDCTNTCTGFSGRASTSHICDPCGLDITKSTSDDTICCF